jgi:hypothetical protein
MGLFRTVLRWPAVFATLGSVLVVAGSAPAVAKPSAPAVAQPSAPAVAQPDDDAALYSQCLESAQEAADEYQKAVDESDETHIVSFDVVCERPDGTPVDPKLWLPTRPIRPAPTPVVTAGHTSCVTGSGRPVVGTALTAVQATTAQGEEILYEYQQINRGETVVSSGSEVLEFNPGDLAPGRSYRWRARVDDRAEQGGDTTVYRSPDDDEQGWSPWCEFTVATDAVDYRKLGDVSLEALNELGLRPDRKYTVSLSSRQQRLLRAGTDVGRTRARMTLTGPRWTDLLIQLNESAFIAEEVAAEADEDDRTVPSGKSERTLVGVISVQLGGPRHPRL